MSLVCIHYNDKWAHELWLDIMWLDIMCMIHFIGCGPETVNSVPHIRMILSQGHGKEFSVIVVSLLQASRENLFLKAKTFFSKFLWKAFKIALNCLLRLYLQKNFLEEGPQTPACGIGSPPIQVKEKA